MKKIFTLLALTISLTINAQLTAVTESGNTGQRLSISNPSNHGDIGSNAVDLSYSWSAGSTTNGATGQNSVAMGVGTIASGFGSFAMGDFSGASGGASVAMGSLTNAVGYASFAMGENSIASGDVSTAIGYGAEDEYVPGESTPFYRNEALGNYSVVIGNRNKSTEVGSVSIGSDNLSQGAKSLAIGENNISTGLYSMAMGLFSESVGDRSFAFGNNAYAGGFNTVAVGSANTIDENASANEWSANNRLLVVGNGQYNEETDTLERSDAFTIMFNGDATLAGNLSVNSDARLKANIISLGSTLTKVLQIDGKSYTMKKDENKKQKIGVLAQDIEKLFPELVSESNGVKSVNYQGLVPVLINALKEQQSEIDQLTEKVQKLSSRDKPTYDIKKLKSAK